MSCQKCRTQTTDSKVKVEEGKRSAVFKNASRSIFYRTRVDGCLIRNTVAADFVVTKSEVGSVVVELKGIDVEHAVEQVSATVRQLQGCSAAARVHPVAGLVVCARYPRFDTKLQRLTKVFVATHRAPLHVVARNDEYELDRVLAFDGPR